MLIDGTSKKVEDIRAGDRLMGDDSTERVVKAGTLVHGVGTMYEIKSRNLGRDTWSVFKIGCHLLRKLDKPPALTFFSLSLLSV
jgi:hypothetical protein